MRQLLQRYNTLEELIANVDIGTLASAASENALQVWLEEHLYAEQAQALDLDRIKALDGDELRLTLCEELGIDLMSLSEYDTRAIERALARHRKKLIYIDFDAGDPDGMIAETQTQLTDIILRGNCSVVYLCGGEFWIPLSKHSMTYIGRAGAIVNITSRGRVDFDVADITLKSLTLYLQYITPNDLTLEKSGDLRYVLGKRIALDETLRRRELYAFLQGRGAFESYDAFARRAANMNGIVVGEILLEPTDFDIERHIFELRPKWRADFIRPIKKFATGKFFYIFIDVDIAEHMFDIERKQLIYADFGTEGSDAAIKVIYLQTETCGRILILLTDKPPARALDEFENTSAGSGIAGYGLELIAAFKAVASHSGAGAD